MGGKAQALPPFSSNKNSYNKYDVSRECGEEEVIIIKQIIITIIITKILY